ncbi:M20 metallopeptidase family protein [Variovorax ginsengisoli]|uniref:Amidohydrolase n=1 Tax=Variovorax ginsengisoli TaxID=363844 RepID=A0ABT9SF12_9BURK|nr:amidohydrolase [Variovorax ginsengisoli]MDP9902810.1 amidohydrolase [Variovorax ginsengisoli]
MRSHLCALLVGTSFIGVRAQSLAPAAMSPLLPHALALSDGVQPKVVEWRRHVHQNPELAYQETNTATYIAQALADMPGVEVKTGVAGTGIKAVLRGGIPGPVVALRADMDALPVDERNDLPFKSVAKAQWQGQPVSVSHVCGHDAHVAMLLGAAQVLSSLRDQLAGTVVFIFQPAEEIGPGLGKASGAMGMVREGVLDNPKVDVVLGQHISNQAPSGTIRYKPGAMLASVDVFRIQFKGTGGHGAVPWASNTPMLAAAETVLGLQNIVSHRLNPTIDGGPTIVTTGLLQSGNRFNVLPETAEIAGTIRALSPTNQRIAQEEIRRRAAGIAASYGVQADVKIDSGDGYGVLVNDRDATLSLLGAFNAATGSPSKVTQMAASMGSEDFGAFGSTGVPVVFWMLNASPFIDKDGPVNHSPLFQIDESAMRVGVRALTAATISQLSNARFQTR